MLAKNLTWPFYLVQLDTCTYSKLVSEEIILSFYFFMVETFFPKYFLGIDWLTEQNICKCLQNEFQWNLSKLNILVTSFWVWNRQVFYLYRFNYCNNDFLQWEFIFSFIQDFLLFRVRSRRDGFHCNFFPCHTSYEIPTILYPSVGLLVNLSPFSIICCIITNYSNIKLRDQ